MLHSFSGGPDGDSPTGLIQGTDGNFYGKTMGGGNNTCTSFFGDATSCETVFKITPTGDKSELYAFLGGADGAPPTLSTFYPLTDFLVQGSDGNFYGTTFGGGSNNTCTNDIGNAKGCGTVFKITPSGVETVLYRFGGGSDGTLPFAGIVQGSDGNFYGTTSGGGINNKGVFFKIGN